MQSPPDHESRADTAAREAESISATAPTLGVVVGENFAAIRKARRWTQDEAASRANGMGLMWGRSQIAALEASNREDVSASHLFLLAATLEVHEARLVDGHGYVRLTDQATVTREWVRARLEARTPDSGIVMGPRARRAYSSMPGGKAPTAAADADLARRLGLAVETVSDAAAALWGRTLHEERDRRVDELGDLDPNDRRVRRGHVTRALAREVEHYLERGTA